MGQSTEELTTQIDGTREALTNDLNALQDRVSPSAIVERRKDAARERVSTIRERIMGASGPTSGSGTQVTDAAQKVKSDAGGAIQGNPLAAGLVAFGAGLVIAALIPASEAEARASQKVVDAAKEHGQPLVDEAKAAGQDIGDSLKESATDAAQQVKASAQDSAQKVQGEATSSTETVRDQAPGQV